MSKDIIYREDAIKAINLRARIPHDVASALYASMAINAIYSVPSADRPQGRWTYDRYNSHGVNRCSECGAEIIGYGENIPFPNCPYCLARMKGADDEID